MIPPPGQNTVTVSNQIILLILYYISSRLVTFLKAIDALIKVSDNFYLTISFKFINFSLQMLLLFVPEMYLLVPVAIMIIVIINVVFSPTLLIHRPSSAEKWCCIWQTHTPAVHRALMPSGDVHCTFSSHERKKPESVNGIPSWFYFKHADSKCLITQNALHKYLCYVHKGQNLFSQHLVMPEQITRVRNFF